MLVEWDQGKDNLDCVLGQEERVAINIFNIFRLQVPST